LRILFIALPDSIHAARWINQVADQGWDLHFFPAYDVSLHPALRNVTTYSFSSVRPPNLDPSVRLRGLWPTAHGEHRVKRLAQRFAPNWMERANWLAWLIQRLQPDVVHSMEFQRAGYLTLEAKKQFRGKSFPPWIATNWGSDVSLFGKLAAHAGKIRALLEACDYHHTECRRDLALARQHGFRGEDLPLLPGGGGFDIKWMNSLRPPGPTSSRRHIALKGYQNWAGRALFGLRALELCSDLLREYVVTVYLADEPMAIAAELFSQRTGIQVEILPHGQPHERIVRLHGSARISLGLSISDAASTSALEAMIMGSFPVQSDTSCFCEWATDGETTLLVPPEDTEKIAAALRRALTDDELVDKAAHANAQRASQGLDKDIIKPQVIDMYSRVARK
jgi:hypothetical protein